MEEINLSNKFKCTLRKNKRRIYSELTPIHYWMLVNNVTSNIHVTKDCLIELHSFHRNNRHWSKDQLEVKLDPEEFVESSSESSLEALKKRWFVNLFGITIPKKI